MFLSQASDDGWRRHPLQYSCLETPMDGGAWKAAVHGVAESRTRLSDFTFTFFHALEKEMATHSSVLARRIPGMEESGGLPSMGLHRVGHDWSDLVAAVAARQGIILWREGHIFFRSPLITHHGRSWRDLSLSYLERICLNAGVRHLLVAHSCSCSHSFSTGKDGLVCQQPLGEFWVS